MRAELFGSLGATGHGHGSAKAVVLGLLGEDPATVDTDTADERVATIRRTGRLRLSGGADIAFDLDADVVLHRRKSLPEHPNGMRFHAWSTDGSPLSERTYFSVGGGFVVGDTGIVADTTALPHPFTTGGELLSLCRELSLPVSAVMYANERVWRPDTDTRAGLLHLWSVMQACVERGCSRDGVLPGGLHVPRRAPALFRDLKADPDHDDPLRVLDWVNLYALAVNEENAAGGRIVTAPTNGAAGIIPAVLHYYTRFVPGATDDGVARFLLTAAAIGILYQGQRLHLRRRGGLPGRGRLGVLDGGGGPVRGPRRHPCAGRERRRDRHGAQPRPDLRPGRRPRPDPVHRAQRHRLGQGDHRGTASPCAATAATSSRLDKVIKTMRETGARHEGQVQGDRPRRPGGQRHRVLRGHRGGAAGAWGGGVAQGAGGVAAAGCRLLDG